MILEKKKTFGYIRDWTNEVCNDFLEKLAGFEKINRISLEKTEKKLKKSSNNLGKKKYIKLSMKQGACETATVSYAYQLQWTMVRESIFTLLGLDKVQKFHILKVTFKNIMFFHVRSGQRSRK